MKLDVLTPHLVSDNHIIWFCTVLLTLQEGEFLAPSTERKAHYKYQIIEEVYRNHQESHLVNLSQKSIQKMFSSSEHICIRFFHTLKEIEVTLNFQVSIQIFIPCPCQSNL